MKYTTALYRQIPLMALLFGVLIAVGGCSKRSLPPCPNTFALADARHLDHYRPGPGRDITDIDYSVTLEAWKGSCGYKPHNEDWDVNMDLQLAFTVTRGPANTTGTAEFNYFAAIPYFYPKPEGKEVFPVKVEFPDGVTTVKQILDPIYLTFPVRTDEPIDTYTVYLGLQLQPSELEWNRRSK